ncbi:sigma-70 family RNA polymerase sigma factor [Streptosporangium sp. NPDC048047]|uniref:RNA polymerase sigma factor n=1 Tax=Streptosporangium sp. NPDC048047 TaxID=3155748 RepID=UPI0034226B78
MDNGVLVEALRRREPGALAALYDFHAPGLYQYCWFMLGGPDGTQVALRDTLITAEARIHELADPARLRAWLYALARGECVRRRPAAAPEPGMPGPGAADRTSSGPASPGRETARPGSPRSGTAAPVLPGDGAAGLAASAWNAVRSLSPQDQEVLELLHRHGLSVPDLARVLGVSARKAGAMDDAARERLRDAITVEVLTRRDHHDCADLARSLDGPPGRLTPQARRRAARHVSGCDACAPHRARQVSAGKVLAVLPPVVPPGTLRVRVMSSFTDPDLVPYRRYVARRAGLLDAAGFPGRPDLRKGRRARAVAGAVAALAATAAVALMSVQLIGEFREDAAGAPEARPVTGEPPGLLLPRTSGPSGPSAVLGSLDGREAAHPAGSGPARPIAPIAFTGLGGADGGHLGGPVPEPLPPPVPTPAPTRGREPVPAPTTGPTSAPTSAPTTGPTTGPTSAPSARPTPTGASGEDPAGGPVTGPGGTDGSDGHGGHGGSGGRPGGPGGSGGSGGRPGGPGGSGGSGGRPGPPASGPHRPGPPASGPHRPGPPASGERPPRHDGSREPQRRGHDHPARPDLPCPTVSRPAPPIPSTPPAPPTSPTSPTPATPAPSGAGPAGTPGPPDPGPPHGPPE